MPDRSIALLDSALDELEAALADDGRLLDEAIVETVRAEVLHDHEVTPYVVSARAPADLGALEAHMQERWGVGVPDDLAHFLRRRNGLQITDAPGRPTDFDYRSWLPASEIVDADGRVREMVTHSGEELPTLPIAVTWPGDTLFALWIDLEEGASPTPRSSGSSGPTPRARMSFGSTAGRTRSPSSCAMSSPSAAPSASGSPEPASPSSKRIHDTSRRSLATTSRSGSDFPRTRRRPNSRLSPSRRAGGPKLRSERRPSATRTTRDR